MCALAPSQHHDSTPGYHLLSGLHSTGPHSHHGGSHYSRAGHLLWSKEPPHSSCHPAPLRPGPVSGQDSSFHLQRQGQMKHLNNIRKGKLQSCRKKKTICKCQHKQCSILTVFYMNIVSATTLVVRESWEQFAVAASQVGGIIQTQVTALTAMMVRFLCVEHSTAANLVEIQLHPHVRICKQMPDRLTFQHR